MAYLLLETHNYKEHTVRMRSLSLALSALSLLASASAAWSADSSPPEAGAASPPAAPRQTENFPQFHVPGFEADLARLQELFRLHHGAAFTDCTLWDPWLPHATLWAAVGPQGSARAARDAYRDSFLRRRIDPDGYVAMQQHRGLAHSDGWPFPTWQQAGGAGWHFSLVGEAYGVQNFGMNPLTSADGWEIHGATVEGIDPASGVKLRATEDVVTIVSPPFACGTIVAPYVRLEWAARGLAPASQPHVSWQFQGETEWLPERRAPFAPLAEADGLQYANVPLYRQPGYAGIVTRYRLTFDRAAGAVLTLKSLITAIDSRHPITNLIYLHGCTEYFSWTADLPFLRANAGRMRRALRFALAEFSVREAKHVRVSWVGHDGRSGLELLPDGQKRIHLGLGVGNNYWDLLPFGGHDALATIYLVDALRRMAALERDLAEHPEWQVERESEPFAASDLAQLADEVRDQAGRFFWSDEAGRFVGWIDLTGRRYDYGFTFVNLEAIHYGLATPDQAQSILAWLDGRRAVAGDTAQGADIYHWRFAPRATTRRNVETYVWPWSAPETIPWGGQVQDGGAVLGFAYFDLMSRLKTLGPDDAWRRLREILAWFDEVQRAGGYRQYYADGTRGTLQGGGPPGGLGMDAEFLESVLVPQVMLYGFLGCQPRPGGLRLSPRLPADWPELTITGIHAQGHVLDLTAQPKELRLTVRASDGNPFRLWLEPGRWEIRALSADGNAVDAPVEFETQGDKPTILSMQPGQTVCVTRR